MAISSVGGSPSDLRAQLEELREKQKTAKEEKSDKSETKNSAEDTATNAQESQSTANTNKTQADSVKTQAQTAKTQADNNYAIAQNATTVAKSIEVAAGTAWQAACNSVTVAQSALASAQAAATEDNPNTDAINSAQEALDRAIEDEKRTKEAFNQAVKAREEAEKTEENAKNAAEQAANALEAAEADASNAADILEETEKALEEASQQLEKAIEELEETEKSLEKVTEELNNTDKEITAKTREAKDMEADVTHMSVEEAEAAGYTVIPEDVTPEQLKAILSSNLNGKYILSNDVDLKDFDWSSVGTKDNPFKGEFNGNGYTISNLNINSDDLLAENVGFFGVTDGAKILNVNFDNATITTQGVARNIGIVVGTASGTHIENVTATGQVGGHSAIGGIVGLVDDNTESGDSYFDNVHSNVQLEGKFHTGGIIGRVSDNGGNLKINNCSSEGNTDIAKMGGGGIIGKAGKRVITVDNCNSKMLIKLGIENPNNYDEGYVGGIIGCADGTYIAICNSNYEGNLDDIQSSYGGYRYGAHVSVYDVKEGLAKDDILKISVMDGIEGVQQVKDANGNPIYEVTISTISGLDDLVDIVRKNPELANSIKYNLSFDFDAMNAKYDFTFYQQYGIVENITGSKKENTVSRSVYFDNEVDAYHEFHDFQRLNKGGKSIKIEGENLKIIFYNRTFVDGLYTDDEGFYYVQLKNGTMQKVENMKYNPQKTWFENLQMAKRLSKEQIQQREKLVAAAHERQDSIYDKLKEQYGGTYSHEDDLPVVDEAERDRLALLAEMGISLTNDEKIAAAKYDIDKEIGIAEMEATGNSGCGMGGNASYLNDVKDPVDQDGFNTAMDKLEEDIKDGKYSADKY